MKLHNSHRGGYWIQFDTKRMAMHLRPGETVEFPDAEWVPKRNKHIVGAIEAELIVVLDETPEKPARKAKAKSKLPPIAELRAEYNDVFGVAPNKNLKSAHLKKAIERETARIEDEAQAEAEVDAEAVE